MDEYQRIMENQKNNTPGLELSNATAQEESEEGSD